MSLSFVSTKKENFQTEDTQHNAPAIVIVFNKFVIKQGNELQNSCSSQFKCSPHRPSVI